MPLLRAQAGLSAMGGIVEKLRAHARAVRTACRVITVLAFALGVAAVVFEWWLTGAAAIAVLAVTEVLIPRALDK